MKLTRSFWLGLGSGLILSALLALLFSPQQDLSDNNAVINPQTALTSAEETKESEPAPPSQSSKSTTNQTLPSTIEQKEPPQIDRDFVIPKGASAEKIAELLIDQDFIKDKEALLDSVHKMGVERQFRAGTFKLSIGLTEEELIKRLLKPS